MKLRFLLILSIYSYFANSLAVAQNDLDADSFFSGTINYEINYTDLKGNNINKKVAAFFDLKHTMYVDAYNYKIINQSNHHVKLFQGKHNAYFFFNRDLTAYKIDQTSKTTQQLRVYEVEDVDTILGYPCKAIKVESDFRGYLYFYNPDIKIDISPYTNYNMEEWNAYLKASKGALPLRVVTIDIRSKFVKDKIAVEVNKTNLSLSEFDFPKTVKLKRLKYGMDLIW